MPWGIQRGQKDMVPDLWKIIVRKGIKAMHTNNYETRQNWIVIRESSHGKCSGKSNHFFFLAMSSWSGLRKTVYYPWYMKDRLIRRDI